MKTNSSESDTKSRLVIRARAHAAVKRSICMFFLYIKLSKLLTLLRFGSMTAAVNLQGKKPDWRPIRSEINSTCSVFFCICHFLASLLWSWTAGELQITSRGLKVWEKAFRCASVRFTTAHIKIHKYFSWCKWCRSESYTLKVGCVMTHTGH